MAIDVDTLVMDQLDPVTGLDSTISAAVTRAIEAQTALQGFDVTMTDKQKVYLSLLVLRSLIPRLLLKFSLKIKDVKSTKAEAKYDRAVTYLDLLKESVDDQLTSAASEAGSPEDNVDVTQQAWPGVAPVEWVNPLD